MSSRSDAFTLSTADLEPDSIDRLVIERIRREVRKAERELKASANVVSAIRGALHEPRLTPAEVRAHQRSDEMHAGDPVAAVLSERVGAALAAGLRAACAEHGIAVPADAPAVLVLRGESGSSGEKVDSQVSTALAEVKARLIPLRSGENAARTSDTSRLFVLAHRQAFDKLRLRLPPGFGGANRTIVFYPLQDTAAATDPLTAASEVEVVRVEGELAPVERRVLELLRDQERGADHDKHGADGGSPDKGEHEKIEKDPLLGQLFHHKYRIVSKIGTGGFGSVYEAKDERGAGNRVAIKILRPEIARTVGLSRTFKNEARRATRLSHPNIVDWKVFDETEDGTQYFVMELVEGEEMDRVLSREGPLPPARVANILLQILDALRVAHHLGEGESILHLDLKPRNVFLVRGRRTGEEKVKVIDFGIGQYIGGEEEEVPDFGTDTPAHLSPGDTTFNPTTLSFVRSGEQQQLRDDKGTAFKRSTACTPEYASPEQCVHVLGLADMVPLDGRSDLYSLGVMGFQMLTGHLPFGRPLVRSDMLRLHMQKPPKKVGSMGVRVPRNLARFIDRCLAKDRDQRFKDTNEAHEVMHKIVHPPVWQTVAKIVAPLLVVIVVAFVGWATKVGARPAAVGLKVVDQDLDLARDSLYMGPSRSSVELALAGTHEEPLASNAALRVVNAEGGKELEGWQAEWLDAGRIRLSRVDAAPGRIQARARIAVAGDAIDLTPFPLTWLGANAWKVDSVRVGETSLDELGTRAIDPVGQSVDLWISGDARAELAEVTMQLAGRTVVLTSNENQGDRVLYRRALDDRGLADGPCELSIVVRDRAGRPIETKYSFAVVTEALEVRDAKLVTLAAGGTDGALAECILFAGRYSIMPRTEPKLALTLNRRADVTYSILKEGKEGGTPPASNKGQAKFEIPLTGIAALGGGAKYTGSIRFDAHDDAYVLHGAGSPRGATTGQPIVFSFSNVEPNVLVKLKDSKGRIQSMLEEAPVFTNERESSVVIERKAQLPMKIVVSCAREGDEKPGVDRETDDLVDLSQYATVVPVQCAADGFYKVRVQAFQVDSAVDARADRPDLDFTRVIGVDTTPPVIAIEGFEPGSVITREHGFAPNMVVVLGGDAAATGSPASPVDVSYDLASRPSGVRLQSKDVGHDLAPGSRTALALASLWSGDAALADGGYELSVRATDGAGNTATPRKLEFVVALSGPTLSIQAPLQGGRWQPNAEHQWQVQLRGSDPNGVERAECMIVRDSKAVEGLVVPLAGDAHASPEDQVFIGGVALTDAWSDAKVWIRSRAWDLAGTASDPEVHGPFTLPLIEPPRPDVIEAQRESRTIGRMRHVIGNSGFLYVFGGQGDSKENKAFKDAGLPSFNKNAGQSRELSWQIEYEPGQIDDFYLDEQEVSVGEFLEFVRAEKSGYSNAALWPAGSDTADEARRRALETELAALPTDVPVTNVTWEEACAYARWIDKRLPSWVEWEFAARGGQQYRAYASFDPANKKLEHERANVDWDGSRDGKPWGRGLGRDRTSDTHVWNLAGNVAEWTSSPVYFVTEGRPTEELSKLALKNRAELCDPTLMKDWERCREFWVAGASFESSRCDFSFVEHRERTAKRPSVGFRCAASLKDVQQQLERGRYRDATQ